MDVDVECSGKGKGWEGVVGVVVAGDGCGGRGKGREGAKIIYCILFRIVLLPVVVVVLCACACACACPGLYHTSSSSSSASMWVYG